ncbi:putative nucleotide-binding alpha-beta plait domain-containing protein [Medicago truncatula]|uniref:Putative nucleotide-binding alpha-beta plait domain-containing protein n=1 Tax=Medicago truncatula TaxID=3880 RepID=A0A072U357_MEDTR|nr:small RNA-binding protein 11, chloroplastic [Medicago truncatula]KEH24157.1 RNA-binding (RRM/RBD/RNP motif) family protein [Medicago truncatula]RHN48719.1 putative nucleotide-binding alpha-beta plait domain-containing protein [Medicago truncatula]
MNYISMASITKIVGYNNSVSPFLLTFRRAIAFKLFVGGLSFHTTEKTLSDAFSNYGQVVEAKVITDRISEKSKGYGFVTFASQDEAEKAITEMNEKALNGRVVFVDYAKPDTKRSMGMPIARGPPEDLNKQHTTDSPQDA